ncbi:mechanosensitive ion channel family protein [Caulobacter sp. KR2-114]|uniref:mechanosensitive ion channel family protein n=1 Tax=Caulobacter sp. KR2-114 TaxID=3400912 RepID=UPI003BFCF03D
MATTVAAAASAAPNAALPVAQQHSAGEKIIHAVRALTSDALHLDPREAAINAGLSVLIVLCAVGLIYGLGWLLRRGAERLAARGLTPSADMPRTSKVAAATWSIIKLVIVVGAAVLVLEAWGFQPLEWLSGRLGATATRIVVLILAGAGAVELSNHLISRLFHGLEVRTADRRRAAQFRTLSPIIRGLVQGVLLIFVGLTVLSELGVKIGPLLAGAGVVGVALGFGAQTLVKDFLTGLFLIIEDIVSVGDNVKIGNFTGRVEAMSLRTIRLRDFDGTLHVFPYSEAQVIHNRTKSFSFAVVQPRISYLADIDRAMAVMKKVGAQMQAEEAFAQVILEPLEIVGIDEFTDAGMVLKARFKTFPGEQWRVGRELNRRLKQAYDAADIEIGYPNVVADRAERRSFLEHESEEAANTARPDGQPRQ